MEEAARSALSHWVNFYVVVGSAAGALTGLQFVVMTLVAQVQAVGSMGEIRAFGTPTVVHFSAAFLISAIMSAPWDALLPLGICLGVFGTAGFAYAVLVIRHARKQTGYAADHGDWLWYVVLPLVAYAGLAVEGILLAGNAKWCFFSIAATALLFLFVGIHNSWDTVTYVAVERSQRLKDRPPPE